jgi:hypothetical protein
LIAVSCALGWSRTTDREKQGRARFAKFPSRRDAKLAREAVPMSDVHALQVFELRQQLSGLDGVVTRSS